MSTKALIGQPVDRVDGRLKVTGGARYAAEFGLKGLLHAVPVLSTVAKGHINSIDASAAKKVPGVMEVMTYRNAMQVHNMQSGDPTAGKIDEPDLLPLQSDRVYYEGQFVAIVIAETLEQAEYAASLVKVSYDAQPAAIGLKKNLDKSYKVKSSLTGNPQYSRGDVKGSLQSAAVKLDTTLTTPVFHHCAMEPHATTADWNEEGLTVYDATQGVTGLKKTLSALLAVPPEKVRIIAYYIGGGFGSKGFVKNSTIITALASKLVSRPVRMNLSRQQVFPTSGRRPQTIQRIQLGADASGKLQAIQHEVTTETSFVNEFVEPSGAITPYLYNCDNVAVIHNLVRLNIGTPCPMRAPGEATGTFALEVAMDELAAKLKMDPVQLRLVNHSDKDQKENKPYSLKNLKECYGRGAEAIGWVNRKTEPGALKEDGMWVGYGMATATYPAHRTKSSAKCILYADGHAEIECATQDIGTGTYTIFTQLAADTLGLPIEKVKVKIGDSQFPEGALSGGSQVTASSGPAVWAAALAALGKVVMMAAADASSPLKDAKPEEVMAKEGKVVLKSDESKGESFVQILKRHGMDKIEAEQSVDPKGPAGEAAEQTQSAGEKKKDEKIAAVKEDEAVQRKNYSMHSFGAHFVKVKVDMELGKVHVEKMVAVMDIGTVMNKKLAENQIMGGQIFSIGMAMLEATEYDPNRGRLVTRDLANYLVPVHADMPEFDVQFLDKPDYIVSPVGARGIGEIGNTGASAAIVNAVYNATGKWVKDLPIRFEKLMA